VVHIYNPSSYSRSRDQEDHDSKPAQANSLEDPIWKKHILKKKNLKKAGGVAQGIDPEFKPQYRIEKKRMVVEFSGLTGSLSQTKALDRSL
jgi:hypothetical protein